MADVVEQVTAAVWDAIRDAANDIAEWTEETAEAALDDLTVGQVLGSNPFVRVLGKDDLWVTMLVRGRIRLGPLTPFVRVEARLGRDVPIAELELPAVEIDDLAGELLIEDKGVFKAAAALGYVDGAWSGRGMFKLVPGFGLDLVLGGVNDEGLMLGLELDLPVAVPLGATGLFLGGIAGDFAYNFVPRMEDHGVPIASPSARDYVAWARDVQLVDRWRAGPLSQTSIGVGIRADLRTGDNFALTLEPIGFTVLTPGPVIILGGAGHLLRSNELRVEGQLAIDSASLSLALGLTTQLKVPASGPELVKANGTLATFFSASDPGSWYIRLGTRTEPVAVTFLGIGTAADWKVTGYFGVDAHAAGFGAALELNWKRTIWKIEVSAAAALRVDALIGWDPVQLQASVELFGELGLKLWIIEVKLRAFARAMAAIPQPTKLEFEVGIELDLPWPVPDFATTAKVTVGDQNETAPKLVSPLVPDVGSKVGALNAVSGRQWDLAATGAQGLVTVWPDVDIVVPFTRHVTDATAKVVGPVVPSEDAGGYTITHRLEHVELVDLLTNTVVPDVRAQWSAGIGGSTTNLHVLGRDPFEWLFPHPGALPAGATTPPPSFDQTFGHGPDDQFEGPRRFGQIVIDPLIPALLLDDLASILATRVLSIRRFSIEFSQPDGMLIPVDRIVFTVVAPQDGFKHPSHDRRIAVRTGRILGDGLQLYELDVRITPGSRFDFDVGAGQPVALFSIRYTIADLGIVFGLQRTILARGRYRLTLSGTTSATRPAVNYPEATTVDWNVVQAFAVDHPDTLRPYIASATPGDARNFGAEEEQWHPTASGNGVPGYQNYAVGIHTKVDHLHDMFDRLQVAVTGDGGETQRPLTTVEQIAPAANPNGVSSASESSRQWTAAHGGSIGPDDELVGTIALPADPGSAVVEVAVVTPGATPVILDRWTAAISRYPDFASHLRWDGTATTRAYGAGGPNDQASCPIPTTVEPIRPRTRSGYGSNPFGVKWRNPFDVDFDNDPWTGQPVPRPLPNELIAPPADWLLPDELSRLVGVGPESASNFMEFAVRSTARFGTTAGEPLDGLTLRPPATVVELITDGLNRPYALWVRTPEPVDWRRVTVSLQVRHVTGTGCPTHLARRHPLELGVDLLPSPDGSSALLVGVMAGRRTNLPRGVFRLTLAFDARTAGLTPLHPLPVVVGGTTETVTHTFVQVRGRDWPRPSSGVLLPAGLIELLERAVADLGFDLPAELDRWRAPRPPGPAPFRPEATPVVRDVPDSKDLP